MTRKPPQSEPHSVAVSHDSGMPADSSASDKRGAMQTATVRVLQQVAQGAEHELIVAISAQDALEELLPLLDRLLAVGDDARLQDTEEAWREAHRRLLNASVLIRVAELRHAIGVKMDYVPSKAGDKEDVEAYLGALERLRDRLRTNAA